MNICKNKIINLRLGKIEFDLRIEIRTNFDESIFKFD